MLLQFTVENYLSFDEATTFSMRAGADKDLLHHVIEGKFPAVKGAAIYGANAAGKSNLVLAMGFARELIVKGRSAGQIISVRPFGSGKNERRTSGFHWQFVYEDKLWSYGFDVTNKYVVEEYLFARSLSGGTEKKWFERNTDESGKVEVKFGVDLRGAAKGKLAQRLNLITENLRGEQPFLTHAIENKINELSGVWTWFQKVLVVLGAETQYEYLIAASHESKAFVEFLSKFVRFADTGIEKLVTHEEKIEWGRNIEGVPPEIQADIEESTIRGQTVTLSGTIGRGNEGPLMMFRREEKTGELRLVTLLAEHTINDEVLRFPLYWESEGTLRMLHLLPSLLHIQTLPTVLIIDELDRRLHTLLVQEFVKIGLNEQSKGQLIFTTHDTNLLDGQLLRRDEIHFVQKDRGHSSLSRLSDWGVRKDLDYEKAYLRGSFEGRPFFGFAPQLQGLDVPRNGTDAPSPTEDELRAQLREAA